jgi:hypothetical protein
MERFNNWMTYSFDDGPIFGKKPSKHSIFNLQFNKTPIQDINYFESLFYNGKMIADHYPQPFDVLLSGGIDSEVIVRVNHELGIKQNVYVIRLENNLNIRDVEDAKIICKDIGINLKIIDWNLQKWIENDAHALYQNTFAPVLGKMIRFAWWDFFDNIIVMGEGEPYWIRELEGDYSRKSKWYLRCAENEFMCSIHAKQIGKIVIGEWYNFTPEVVMAYHRIPHISKLLNDEIIGKQSCWSSRVQIHQQLWPSIKPRPKLVGYEGPTGNPGDKPEFLKKFQEEIIGDTSDTEHKFTVSELESLRRYMNSTIPRNKIVKK